MEYKSCMECKSCLEIRIQQRRDITRFADTINKDLLFKSHFVNLFYDILTSTGRYSSVILEFYKTLNEPLTSSTKKVLCEGYADFSNQYMKMLNTN